MDHVPSQFEHDADVGATDRPVLTRRAALLLLFGLAAAIFLALGVWQLQRLSWKQDLIARIEARIHAPPVPLTSDLWTPAGAAAAEYRRVRVEGRFLHGAETLVQALSERGAGYWVLTPLLTGSGTVLVNRGFVPPKVRAPAARATGQVEGPVAVIGLLRVTEPGGGFLRSNDPAAERWYSRDVAAIAGARRLDRVAPFFVDAGEAPNPGGYPVGGLTVVRFRNNHLVYALTWFALAGLAIAAIVLLLRERRG